MFGISRSATVVLGYLMFCHNMYLDEAIKHVLNSRLCIFPNDGFILQLIEFEKSIFGTMSFLPNADGIQKCKQLIHTHAIK